MGSNKLMIVLGVIVIAGAAYFLTRPQAPQAPEVMDQEVPGSDVNETEALTEARAENEVSFDISGKNFEFSQNKLEVKKGQTVTVNFTSEEGFHDWKIEGFDVATEQVNTGGTTSVTFVADKVGEFEYYCSVGQHRSLGMVGTLTVSE